jgi:hypothetical protein
MVDGMSVQHPIPIRLTKESDDDKQNYYNKQAAEERQKVIDQKKAEYLAAGGKIQVVETK